MRPEWSCWIKRVLMVALAIPPFPVAAESSDSVRMDEVTVIATKGERKLVTTPGSVNVISRKELDNLQAQSPEDFMRYQPGVDIGSGPRAIAEKPVIRGLGGSRVLVTVDGSRLNFQSGHKGRFFLDTESLKRVEVSRGPSSALWGAGALGGVVSFQTKDPTDYLQEGQKFGFYTKVRSAKADEATTVSPTLFGRVGSSVEYLLNYTGHKSGDVHLGGDAGTLNNSFDNAKNGLGKAVWHIGEANKITLSHQVFTDEQRLPITPDSNTSSLSRLADRTTKQNTSRVAYSHQSQGDSKVSFDASAYRTAMDLEEVRPTDQRVSEVEFKTMGGEIRAGKTFGDPEGFSNGLMAGVEFYRDEQIGRRAGSAYSLFPDAEGQSAGVFLQNEMNFGDRLTVIPGLRWDSFKNTADGQNDVTEDRLNPKVGAVGRVTESLFIEASYSEGMRLPHFGESFIFGVHHPLENFVPNTELKSETGKNIETGFRIHRDGWLTDSDQARFQGTYFRGDYDDFIDSRIVGSIPNTNPFIPFPISLRQDVNVQKARLQGVELEGSWAWGNRARVWGNYTQVRGSDLAHNEDLSNIPADKGVVGVEGYIPGAGITLGFRSQLVDKQERVPAGEITTPGYSVHDVYASWQPGFAKGLRVDAGVDNVTDKEYRRHLANLPEAGVNPKFSVSWTSRW